MLQNLARVDEVEVRLREVGRALLWRRASMVPSDETNIKRYVEDALERARDLSLPFVWALGEAHHPSHLSLRGLPRTLQGERSQRSMRAAGEGRGVRAGEGF
jgi:hypothetical protein